MRSLALRGAQFFTLGCTRAGLEFLRPPGKASEGLRSSG
jgi:hypothetical protein